MDGGGGTDTSVMGNVVEEAQVMMRCPSSSGLADLESAAQHDVESDLQDVVELRQRFSKAIMDWIIGIPNADLPNALAADLRKWEKRFTKAVVHDALGLLCCSRHGLTGQELQALLHLNRDQWVSLRACIRPYLRTSSQGFGDAARVRLNVEFIFRQTDAGTTNIYQQNAICTAQRAAASVWQARRELDAAIAQRKIEEDAGVIKPKWTREGKPRKAADPVKLKSKTFRMMQQKAERAVEAAFAARATLEQLACPDFDKAGMKLHHMKREYEAKIGGRRRRKVALEAPEESTGNQSPSSKARKARNKNKKKQQQQQQQQQQREEEAAEKQEQADGASAGSASPPRDGAGAGAGAGAGGHSDSKQRTASETAGAVMKLNVALKVAHAAAQQVMRVRKLTKVYQWPQVGSDVAAFYHTALASYFAARAAGQSLKEATRSILTGTAIKARTFKPAAVRASPKSVTAAGRRWDMLRSAVMNAKYVKGFFHIRKRQNAEYLQALFGKSLKRVATAIPIKLGDVGEGGIRVGRWVSRSNEGATAGLRNMAYHMLQAKRKKEALSVLLDLQYVEAMAASGYIYELIDCLCHLQTLLEGFIHDLEVEEHQLLEARNGGPIEETKAPSSPTAAPPGSPSASALDDPDAALHDDDQAQRAKTGPDASMNKSFSLLAIIQSDGFALLAVEAKLKRGRQRLACVLELLEFLRSEVKTLTRFPAMTFQLAAARPDSSLLGKATRQHRIKRKELRPFLRYVNKPQHKNACVAVLQGIKSKVLDLSYSSSGKLIATATQDGHVVVWDLATGTLKYLVRHPARPGTDVVHAPPVDVEAQASIPPEPTHDAVTAVAFCPGSSRYLVSGDAVGRILQWDITTGQSRELLPASAGLGDGDDDDSEVHSVLSGDDMNVLDGMVDTQDITAEEMGMHVPETNGANSPRALPSAAHGSRVTAISFIECADYLLTGDESGIAVIWDFTRPGSWNLPTEGNTSHVSSTPRSDTENSGSAARRRSSPARASTFVDTAPPVPPCEWLRWKAQDDAIQVLHFANPGWKPQLEVAVARDVTRSTYRSALAQSKSSAELPKVHKPLHDNGVEVFTGRQDMELTMSTSHSLSSAGGGLTSKSVTNSLRQSRSCASLLMTRSSDPNNRWMPPPAGIRVSPVVMGNHVHTMFPHGAATALVCTMPKRLQSRSRKVWGVPEIQQDVVAALARSVSSAPAATGAGAGAAAGAAAGANGITMSRSTKVLPVGDAHARTPSAVRGWSKTLSAHRRRSSNQQQPVEDEQAVVATSSDEEDDSDDDNVRLNPALCAAASMGIAGAELHETRPNDLGVVEPMDLIVVTGSRFCTHVWKLSPQGDVRKIGQAVGESLDVRSTPKGVTLLTRRSNSVMKIVASSGERIELKDASAHELQSATFSHTKDRVATFAKDTTVRVYVCETGKRVGVMHGHLSPITCIVYAPDGRHVATGSENGVIRVWLPEILPKDVKRAEHRNSVRSVAMTTYESEGKVATMSADGDVKCWTMLSGRMFAKEEGPASGKPRSVEFTGRDELERLTMVSTGAVRQWWPDLHAPGNLPYKDLKLASNVRIGVYNDYGDLYAFVNMDATDGVQIVYKNSGKLRTNFAIKTAHTLRFLRFSPDSRMLLAAGEAGVVSVYDLAQARHAPTGVQAVESTAKSGTTHLRTSTHAIYDRSPLCVLRDVYRLNVHDLVFSPDGTKLLWIPLESPVMRIWDFVSAVTSAKSKGAGVAGTMLLNGHVTRGGSNVHAAVWSPDGQRIASVGNDGTLRIWDANRAGQLHRVLNAHDGEPVTFVSWGATGRRIVTAGSDRSVRVWDADTAVVMCLWLLQAPATITSLAVNALATKIVVGDHLGGVTILHLESPSVDGNHDIELELTPVGNNPDALPVLLKLANAPLSGSAPAAGAGAGAGAGAAGSGTDADAGGTGSVTAGAGLVAAAAAGSANGSTATASAADVGTHGADAGKELPIISMSRQYLNEKHLWHSKLTACCVYCSNRFNVYLQIIDIAKRLQGVMQLEGPKQVFFRHPKLVMRCPSCKRTHRLNPLIMDNPLGVS